MQTICCVLKIKRSCGCYEDVNYCGDRDGTKMDKYEKLQASKKCTNCYESAIRKVRGL